MSKLVKIFDGRSALALAFASAAAALLAGCSSDVAQFDNPFQDSARFSGTDATPTGALSPPAPIGGGPSMAQVAPLAAPVRSAPISEAPLAPVRPVGSGGWDSASLAAPARAAPPPVMSSPGLSHGGAIYEAPHGVWAADGGSVVVIHPGQNAATIAERYDVPLEALVRVNGLVSAAQMRPGMRIVIPVYSASRSGAPSIRQDGRQDRRESERDHVQPPRRQASLGSHTSYRFVTGPSGRRSGASEREQAEEGRAHEDKTSRSSRQLADRKRAGRHSADAASDDASSDNRSADRKDSLRPDRKDEAEQRSQADQHRDAAQEADAARAPTRALAPQKASLDKTATGSLEPESADAVVGENPDFRWPARGRIIEGFRPGANDGINIALPDGTAVRAVAGGVVAYAGDELEGYGNLVLIRHPDGYVSAYANNGQLEVKRGETVKRGQVIALSGQSGNVASPQLHFELRKGQTPVDPMKYLTGM